MDEKNRTLKQEKSKLQNFEKNEKQRDQTEKLKKLTGEDHYVGTNKDPFAGEPFNQVMHKNSNLLNSISYLTQAEESFLFRIQAYLEFRNNVIICRDDKFKRKRKNIKEDFELPKAATVSEIAEMIGKSREKTSLIMNSLKKEILLNPEGAGQIIENGRTVSPRTWVVNPYIMI